MPPVSGLLYKINEFIINPIILLLFAVALAVFFYGIVKFIWNNNSEEERAKGKRNMVYGIIGLFIMVSVFGIIQVILSTFGITAPAGTSEFIGG